MNSLRDKKIISESVQKRKGSIDYTTLKPIEERSSSPMKEHKETQSPQKISSSEDTSLKEEKRERLKNARSQSKSPFEKFYRKFDLPDEVVQESFLCALLLKGTLLVQGTMYITNNLICFYANVFGKKTELAIPFSEVTNVERCKILKSIPNSIEVQTTKKKYFWASFLHREAAYRLIIFTWKACMNSIGDTRTINYDETTTDIAEEENPNWMEEEAPPQYPPMTSNCCHDLLVRNVENIPPKYTQKYPICAKSFYLHFLSDSSFPFWKEIHSTADYKKFEMGSFIPSVEKCCWERNVSMKSPISFGKTTRVSQQQRCRFISENEVLFETTSHSFDVPYANHFVVDAVWRVKDIPTGCELTITVFVRFTRKVWIQSIIELSAIEGSKDWFETWIQASIIVSQHLVDDEIKKNSLRSSCDVIEKSKHALKRYNESKPRNVNVSFCGFIHSHGKFIMILLMLLVLVLFSLCVYYFFKWRSLSVEIGEFEKMVDENIQLRLNILKQINDLNGEDKEISETVYNFLKEAWKSPENHGEKMVDWKNEILKLESTIASKLNNL